MPSIEAYSNCQWKGPHFWCSRPFKEGSDKYLCNPEFPNVAVQSSVLAANRPAFMVRSLEKFSQMLADRQNCLPSNVYECVLTRVAGQKSYCCKNYNNGAFLPPAFSQCYWAVELREEMSIAQRCEAYCPPNYLKIAVDSGHCAGEDKMALCCHGYKPSDLPTTSTLIHRDHCLDCPRSL
jgi:hypothetical protein